ncbi:Protein of unknown function [Pyronema omphalodes CBS 100304]|uniref:Uncharacterized protein n=1 Tax=Pyronema omphalodes (strain CBS 100304) TaxID=1076935 RepID=U4KU62_PYROM|nr:Protein of unknown function [Pyronema omphalodes CBS 100304]
MAAPTTVTKTRLLRSAEKNIQTVTSEVDWNKKRPKIEFSADSPAVKADERGRAKRRKVSQWEESKEAPKRVTRGATKRAEKAVEAGGAEVEKKEKGTQEKRRSSMLLPIRETSSQVGTPTSAKDVQMAEAGVGEVKGPTEQQERQEDVMDAAPVEAPATESVKPTEETKESNAEIQMEIQTETTIQVELAITADHPPARNAAPAPAAESQTTPYQSTQMQLSAARNFFLDAMAESPIRFDTFNTPESDKQKPTPKSAPTESPFGNLSLPFIPGISMVPSEPTPVPAPKVSLPPPQLPPFSFGGSAPDTSLGGGLGGGFTIHTSPKHTPPQQQHVSRRFTPINARWNNVENGFTQGTQNMFPAISPPKPEDFLPPPTTPRTEKPSGGFPNSNSKLIYHLSPPNAGDFALPPTTPNAGKFSSPFKPAETATKANKSPTKSSKASKASESRKSAASSKRSNTDGFIHYTPTHPPPPASHQVTATPVTSKTTPFVFNTPHTPPQVTKTPRTSRTNNPFAFPTPKPLPQVTATPGFTPAPQPRHHAPPVAATPGPHLRAEPTSGTTGTTRSNNPFAFPTPALAGWNTSSSPKGFDDASRFRSSPPAQEVTPVTTFKSFSDTNSTPGNIAVAAGVGVKSATVKKTVGFSGLGEKEKEKEKEDEPPLSNTADTEVATQPNTHSPGMLSLSYMPDTQKSLSQTPSAFLTETQKPLSQTPSGYSGLPGFPAGQPGQPGEPGLSGLSAFPDHQMPLSLNFSPEKPTQPTDDDNTMSFDIPPFPGDDDEPTTSLADNEDVKDALNLLGPGWSIDDDLRAMAGTSTPVQKKGKSRGSRLVGKKNRWA